jgi:hypothetical protein
MFQHHEEAEQRSRDRAASLDRWLDHHVSQFPDGDARGIAMSEQVRRHLFVTMELEHQRLSNGSPQACADFLAERLARYVAAVLRTVECIEHELESEGVTITHDHVVAAAIHGWYHNRHDHEAAAAAAMAFMAHDLKANAPYANLVDFASLGDIGDDDGTSPAELIRAIAVYDDTIHIDNSGQAAVVLRHVKRTLPPAEAAAIREQVLSCLLELIEEGHDITELLKTVGLSNPVISITRTRDNRARHNQTQARTSAQKKLRDIASQID